MAGALLPRAPGAYAILFLIEHPLVVWGGRWVKLEPHAALVYVGGAWGPGGLRARLGRHLAAPGKRRWHVDQLASTPLARIVVVTWKIGAGEEYVATRLRALGGEPLTGFGDSDAESPRAFLFPSCSAASRALERLAESEGGWMILSTASCLQG